MAEPDIIQDLRKIQSEVAELRTGYARMENEIRGLTNITVQLVGAMDRITDRLLALEANGRSPIT